MRLLKQHKLLEPGARVANFHLPLLDGGEASLPDIVAHGSALLAFFKISCPVCQLTLPHLQRIHSHSKLSSSKLLVYGVSQNSAADTRDFNHRFGVTFPTMIDSSKAGYLVSNAFGISHVPTLFLLGPGGVVERVTEGWLKAEIRKLGELAGVDPFQPDVSVPESKAG
ncbi:MAG TPA: TlpA disulfide reductase family protein [Bryobacteraceae bacterium]|jgi:peroxiredoxin